MLDEQEQVLLNHHRNLAGEVEQQYPSGQPQSLLMSSYRTVVSVLRLFLKAKQYDTRK
jgi:hypothetical protein